jgi:peroxiredoxin family protein
MINDKERIEKEFDQEQYIEALEETVKDLKIALYTITMMEDLKDVQNLAEDMLNDFSDADSFLKITTLQKENALLKSHGLIDNEGKFIRKQALKCQL